MSARHAGTAPLKEGRGIVDRDVRAVADLLPLLMGVALDAHVRADTTVSMQQYRLLFVLNRHGPMSAQSAADRLRLHRSAITRLGRVSHR